MISLCNPSEWVDQRILPEKETAKDIPVIETFSGLRGYREGYIFTHPVFTALHEREGSGWYTFEERVGLGGIFRLTSNGVIPFNPPQEYGVAPYHDAYDILRAIDEFRIKKVSH